LWFALNQTLNSYVKQSSLRNFGWSAPDIIGRHQGYTLSKRQPAGIKGGGREEIDPAIFDQKHLRQYTGEDLALQRELVNLFLGHFAPVRTQFDAACSAQDWKFAAHSLKGSARSIGALRVAAVAEKLDTMDFEEPRNRKTRLLDDLDTAMAAFAAEVKKAIG
jgi:HPt (histidine-containing phosphotransfer) domain-containing protein